MFLPRRWMGTEVSNCKWPPGSADPIWPPWTDVFQEGPHSNMQATFPIASINLASLVSQVLDLKITSPTLPRPSPVILQCSSAPDKSVSSRALNKPKHFHPICSCSEPLLWPEHSSWSPTSSHGCQLPNESPEAPPWLTVPNNGHSFCDGEFSSHILSSSDLWQSILKFRSFAQECFLKKHSFHYTYVHYGRLFSFLHHITDVFSHCLIVFTRDYWMSWDSVNFSLKIGHLTA